MKVISIAEFIAKAEAKSITEIFPIVYGSEKRIYGLDASYDFTRAQAGKMYELVYAVVP